MLEVNAKIFNEIVNTDKLVVLDFWASWCVPCKAMAPVFEDVSSQFKDQVVMAKVKVDDCSDLASKFKVMSVPTLVFIKGGEVIESSSGFMTKEIIINKINSYLQ